MQRCNAVMQKCGSVAQLGWPQISMTKVSARVGSADRCEKLKVFLSGQGGATAHAGMHGAAEAVVQPWYAKQQLSQACRPRIFSSSDSAHRMQTPARPQPAPSAALTSARLVLHHALGALLVQYPVAALAAANHIARLERVLGAAVAADVGHLRQEVGQEVDEHGNVQGASTCRVVPLAVCRQRVKAASQE